MFSFSLSNRDSLLPPGFKFLALQFVRRSFSNKGLSTSPTSVELMGPATVLQVSKTSNDLGSSLVVMNWTSSHADLR